MPLVRPMTCPVRVAGVHAPDKPQLRFAFSIACLLLAVGCKPEGAPGGPGQFPPAQVSVITIEPKILPVAYEYVGQTAGSREVEVRARVTGILLKRNYREGAPVKQGQSLFIIDSAPFETALARTEAELAGSEARLAQARRNAARLKPT